MSDSGGSSQGAERGLLARAAEVIEGLQAAALAVTSRSAPWLLRAISLIGGLQPSDLLQGRVEPRVVHLHPVVEVDGGIKVDNIRQAADAGAADDGIGHGVSPQTGGVRSQGDVAAAAASGSGDAMRLRYSAKYRTGITTSVSTVETVRPAITVTAIG